MKKIVTTMLMLGLLPLAACVSTSERMTRSTNMTPAPEEGKALVVFLRPSNYGGGIQSTVYDATERKEKFIGIVSANTKIAHQAMPGKHLFMVIGENADFVNATLDAGKTYYILVSPRMGVWKARFSLLPIHSAVGAKYSLRSADFRGWQTGTYFVDRSPAADAWYAKNAQNVAQKRAEYMKKWESASETQLQELTLLPEDGI